MITWFITDHLLSANAAVWSFLFQTNLCTSLNLQFNALLMKTEAPWQPLFNYCPVCMNLVVSSLVFRLKDWFVFSSFLWMMPPDLTARPSAPVVSLIESRGCKSVRLEGTCQFCGVFVGEQQSAGTGGRLGADSISLHVRHGSDVTKNHETPLNW